MRIVKFIFTLLLILPTFGQEKPKQEPILETLVEAKIPVANKHLFFIVDTSGSMEGDKVIKAIATVVELCQAPVDDFQVTAISFGSGAKQWDGTEDLSDSGQDITPPGWSLMPSQDNLKILEKWLDENKDTAGTNVINALVKAFEESKTIKDLSIILISDCDFDAGQSNGEVISVIQKLQEKRKESGFGLATFGIFGIEVPDFQRIERDPIKVELKKDFIGIADLGIYNFSFSEVEEEEEEKRSLFDDPY